jgi:hypothetical protein
VGADLGQEVLAVVNAFAGHSGSAATLLMVMSACSRRRALMALSMRVRTASLRLRVCAVQPASLGLQVAVDAFGRPGEFEAALQLRKPFSLNNGVRERGMSHDID